MKTSSLKLAVALSLALPVFATANLSAAPHTPRKGSLERTAIMGALHGVLGGGRHQPLITASHFKVEKGWAYVSGGFEYADGAPLEEQFTEGSGTNFSALLHKEGKFWKVKRRLYHGDVVAPEFMRAYPQAPKAIFR